MSLVEKNRFLCKDDDGTDYTVIEYRTATTARYLKEPDEVVVGGRGYLRTGRGFKVSQIDSATFKIECTGKIIRKVGDKK